ncbi:MAG: hypothetical protein WD696_19935 [Bryobacteraceae bacterium]
MHHYEITMSTAPAGQEVEVVLRGPGIEPVGRYYIFATTARCETFVAAVNFAYEQGVRDAMSRAHSLLRQPAATRERLLVVTGGGPDNLKLRPERWWEQVKRRWRLGPGL